jgi:hypothetical protein
MIEASAVKDLEKLIKPSSCVVFDLDGTIANVDHRTPLVRAKKPQWDEFYRQAINDSPNEWAIRLMQMTHAFYTTLIVSARPETYRKETEDWLAKHGARYSHMYMVRPDRNYTGDAELKRQWLRGFGKEKILFVVDDRQSVVDMWRAEGVTCLQCYAWEEYKHAEGKETTLDIMAQIDKA